MSIDASIIYAPTEKSFDRMGKLKKESWELGEKDVMLFFFGKERINGLYEESTQGLAAQQVFDEWVWKMQMDYMKEINR